MTSIDKDAMTLPVVEEQISVGKRQVERGGVNVRTRIIETPAQKQVTLRDEHVTVERHPVNAPPLCPPTPSTRRRSR